MITTRMNVKEVLDEFEKDFKEVIQERFFGYIKANKKAVLKSQRIRERKSGKEEWVSCPGVRRITSKRGNKYRAAIKGRFIGSSPGYQSTTYIILNDSVTGKKVVYLLPVGNDDRGLIIFSSKFFREFNEAFGYTPDSFEESVDNFMKTDKYFTLYEHETDDPRYNCQVDLGGNMIGFGQIDNEKATFQVRHFKTWETLLEEAKRVGLEIPEKCDPLTIYLGIRNSEEEKKTESTEDLYKTLREREMAEAWAAYENGEL